MAELSLSTAWSKDRYKHLGEFVEDAREFGYSQIELSSNLTADQLSEVLGVGATVISSVHCPCPAWPSPGGLKKADLSLSAPSTEELSKAVEEAKFTIELASRVGAKAVILHAGYVRYRAARNRVQSEDDLESEYPNDPSADDKPDGSPKP